MTPTERQSESSTYRTAYITKKSKTAPHSSSAPPIFLPPTPPLNPVSKPSVSVDVGVEEVLGKNDKTDENIANYRTIVSSNSISLVRVRAPLVPPRCSNEWSTKGKQLPNSPFKEIWSLENSQDKHPPLLIHFKGS